MELCQATEKGKKVYIVAARKPGNTMLLLANAFRGKNKTEQTITILVTWKSQGLCVWLFCLAMCVKSKGKSTNTYNDLIGASNVFTPENDNDRGKNSLNAQISQREKRVPDAQWMWQCRPTDKKRLFFLFNFEETAEQDGKSISVQGDMWR